MSLKPFNFPCKLSKFTTQEINMLDVILNIAFPFHTIQISDNVIATSAMINIK